MPQQHEHLPSSGHYDVYQIIWFKKGKGSYLIDLKQYPITDGVTFCLYPGQIHSMLECSQSEAYIVSFSSSFINIRDEDFNSFLSPGPGYNQAILPTIKNEEHQTEMQTLVTQMLWEYQSTASFKSELLRALLKVMLIRLSMHQSEKVTLIKPDDDQEIFFKFTNLVSSHFSSLKKVSDYASLLHVKPNYLNLKVKTVSGNPASFHIKHHIVMEAKRLAIWEDLCLKEIAYALNFDDISHFSKFFKNVTGTNFSDFMKSV
ncbi:AraC family transcriptional regulator [Dyadobacter frigoris]|nr:AraC family transcriptional regulator [Dyadobacter frigoris]